MPVARVARDSDLDIAILPKDASLALRVELDLQVALERATRRTVDIVRLDHAPTLLRWEIARHGRVLVADPATERVRFLAQAAAEHADFAPDLQQAATLFRRHLASRSAPEAKPAVTEPLLVHGKLSLLREHLSRVRRRHPAGLDALRSDVDVQDALAMSLLVATQEAIDLAMHIGADEGWGLPGSHAEAFELVARHGVISTEHAAELARVVAVRNRIAHGYASVDLERLWTEIPAGADTLERFADAVARYVDGANP